MSSQVFSITALAFAALSMNACSLEDRGQDCACYEPDVPEIPIDLEEEPEAQ